MNPEKVNNAAPVASGASSSSATTGLNRSTSDRVEAALARTISKGFEDIFLISGSRSVSSQSMHLNSSTSIPIGSLEGNINGFDGYTSCEDAKVTKRGKLREAMLKDDPDADAERNLRRQSESTARHRDSSSSQSHSNKSDGGSYALKEKRRSSRRRATKTVSK